MIETDTHKGWHSRGYLPHFDAANVIQSVIFRLADSLPSHVLDRTPDPTMRRKMADATLDAGLGACALRETRIAGLVQTALLHFDGNRYRMLAWCIMPNHIHALIEPIEANSLSAIVQSWKSFTAKRANGILERQGPFWAPDYFDRYIRDQGHFQTSVHYIEHNPVKAGLVDDADQWPWGSAQRRRGIDSGPGI